MMAVDASAVLAIFLNEPDGQTYKNRLAMAGQSAISAVNYWEVLARARLLRSDAGAQIIAGLLADLRVDVVPADAEMAEAAVGAFLRYRGRPARLNLGDCFAYALAEREGDGLLFKGNDFSRTDVKPGAT